MNKKTIIVLLFSFFISHSFSQNIKFGKVKLEELKQEQSKIDSLASAEYLYKEKKIYFEYRQQDGLVLITEVYDKIKVYNADGYSNAIQKIRLYKNPTKPEELLGFKAVTYNAVNGKVVKDKIRKEAVFEEKLNGYWENFKFTMPNVQKFCIIEYKYKIESQYFTNIDPFYFQYSIPVVKLNYRLDHPEYLHFKVHSRGINSIESEKFSREETISYVKRSYKSFVDGSTGDKVSFVMKFDADQFNEENILPIAKENYIDNINNYRDSKKYELEYVENQDGTSDFVSQNWGDVVGELMESDDFGMQLGRSKFFEDDFLSFFKNTSQDNYIKIYELLKSKVKWNGKNSVLLDSKLKSVYTEGKGSSSEINLMLVNILRKANYKAYPIVLSSKKHGIPISATLDGFNHVICGLKIKDKIVFLDATLGNAPANIISDNYQNGNGLIIYNNKEFDLIPLNKNFRDRETTLAQFNLNLDGSFNIKSRKMITNNQALEFRSTFLDLENLKSNYQIKNPGIELIDLKTFNVNDLYKPIRLDIEAKANGYLDMVSNKIIFKPMMHYLTTENKFKADKRNYPIDFRTKYSNTYRITIKLPEGYKILELPENRVITLGADLAKYSYSIKEQSGNIILNVSESINSSMFSVNYFDNLKAFYENIITQENESVILEKL